VRAVSNAELKSRVLERERKLRDTLKGEALGKALGRLDAFARTGVAAFDPVTGDVLVAVERVKGGRLKEVLQHELAHHRFYALKPKEREAVVAAFTRSPVWKGLEALVVSDDPTIAGASKEELVSEVLSQAVTAPNGQLARLAASILESKALAPLREARASSVDWGGELEFQPWNELDGPDASANWSRLNETQKKALRTAEASAKKESAAKRAALVARAKKLGFTEAELDTVLEHLKTSAQITINFQPDKKTTSGKPLIDAFLAEGRYVNQFESKITSGSFGPTPGSARDGWEKTIFRGDYHDHPLDPKERPKYGSLNAEEGAAGGATHYGNSFLVLKDGVKNRLTMTPSDSSGANAGQVGTSEYIGVILNDPSVSDQKFQAIMNRALGRPVPPGSTGYGYIEVQVHGPVDFKTDVARIVANAMYRGNADYERKLREFAAQLGVQLDWTNGTSVFDDDNVPVNYAWAAIGSARIANVSAPAAPPKFTPVRFADTVAFVPAEAGATTPDKMPRGYAEVKHAAAGIVLVPERFVKDGKLADTAWFGASPTGAAAPLVSLGSTYAITAATGYGVTAVDGPAAPAGYTVVSASLGAVSGIAFVPIAAGTAAPAEIPAGFAAIGHPRAGTVIVPKNLTDSGKLSGGVIFGAPAASMPATALDLAPPAPVAYSFPSPYGPAHGATSVSAPPAPPDYTAVRYGSMVAFVPTKLDAPLPDEIPSGYVSQKHAALGTVFVPAAASAHHGGAVTLGVTATGLPAPAVPIARSYKFASYAYPVEAAEPPPGYTGVRLGPSSVLVAFVPTAGTTPVPDTPPEGYVALKDDEAGTLFVPESVGAGGVLAAGWEFGDTADGMPNPVMSLAPPPPVSVTIPATPGAGHYGGGRTLNVPAPPPDYTIVGFMGSVAYVPAKAGAKAPKRPPTNFVEVVHPKAGRIYVPNGYSAIGPGTWFGKTATGYAEPAVKIETPMYTFPGGTVLPGEEPPPGYTVLLFAGRAIAFAPATDGAKAPKEPPPGYVAVKDDEAGTLLVPEAYAPSGTITPGYEFGATAAGLPEPRVALAPPPPVTVTIPPTPALGYGARGGTYSVPPPPADYTIVGCSSGGVAYVPAKRDAAAPKRPPSGYAEIVHPRAGRIFIAAGYASGALPAGIVFGKTAAGFPEPEVPVETPVFSFPTGHTLAGEAPPKGYTVVMYAGSMIAYAPAVAGAKAPKELPPGYVAVEDDEAGTLLLPEAYAPGGVRTPGYEFGPTATGQPEPLVSLIPPPPVSVTIPGGATYSVPPPPDGYTIVGCASGGIAYVPVKADAPAPKRPPSGYVEVTHPRSGKIFMAAGYADGALPAGVVFGKTATGYAEPEVPIETPVFSFPGRTVAAEAPPLGYTAVLYGGYVVAYVPAVADAKVPASLPPGYVAVGTHLIPEGYAPGGVRTSGYLFGPTAAGQPAPAVAVEGT